MGTFGPIPNRSDQRVRRNLPETPIEKVTAIGNVEIPELGLEDPHPLVVDMYESLKNSAQNRFFEPSDWQVARYTFHLVNKVVKRDNPSAQMVAAINQMLSLLLMTEGDRRRVRLEIERNQSNDDGNVVELADLFRKRLGQG